MLSEKDYKDLSARTLWTSKPASEIVYFNMNIMT